GHRKESPAVGGRAVRTEARRAPERMLGRHRGLTSESGGAARHWGIAPRILLFCGIMAWDHDANAGEGGCVGEDDFAVRRLQARGEPHHQLLRAYVQDVV